MPTDKCGEDCEGCACGEELYECEECADDIDECICDEDEFCRVCYNDKLKKVVDRPVVNIIRKDGNAFAIIAECRQAAKKANWDSEKIEKVTKELMSSDYNDLLMAVATHFDVR